MNSNPDVTGAPAASQPETQESTAALERNLRAALADSRQRYEDLVEISSDFAWETDADGAFAFVSPRGALGYTAGALIGRIAASLVVEPRQAEALPFLDEQSELLVDTVVLLRPCACLAIPSKRRASRRERC